MWKRTWRGLSLLGLCLQFACSADSTNPLSADARSAANEPPEWQAERVQVLSHLATEVVLPTYSDFVTAAVALEQATAAYATDRSAENQQAARAAWREAMAIWQRAELLQLGPAGVMGEVVGGMDLRDEIYSWPLSNACRVDQELVEETHLDVAQLAAEAVNTRGLDAIEYLLFVESGGNACKSTANINTLGTWSELGDTVVAERRAAYAAACANLVAEQAESLHDQWSAAGGDFAGQLSQPGAAASVFGSTSEAMNAISDAMFYVDKVTKDMKLAGPVGLSGCDTDTCPELLESRYAQDSKAHIQNNLLGLHLLFHGAGDEGRGMVDLLVLVGAQELADEMSTALDAAMASVAAIPAPLNEAIASDAEAVVAAHTQLVAFTTLLKTQFLAVLDLEIPQRAASDND